MYEIDIDDILVRHMILFNFNTEKSLSYYKPHYLFKLKHSIHFKALLNNNFDDYDKLIKTTVQDEHSKAKFIQLNENFRINLLTSKKNKITLSWNNRFKKYIVVDGVHRLAIMAHKKLIDGKLPLSYLKIIDDPTNKVTSKIKQRKIKKNLKKTIGKSFYNKWNNRTKYGYHSYNLENINIPGQRKPQIRLKEIKRYVDFKEKNVLDFGCNVGAMLHHLPEIKSGIGFDFDKKCISAANKISKILERDNLFFKIHDFDRDGYNSLRMEINFKPDIILILSMGSWIETWRELYSVCISFNAIIILETNNDSEGETQLEYFRNKMMKLKLIIDNSNDDITGNTTRKTYLIK